MLMDDELVDIYGPTGGDVACRSSGHDAGQ